MTQIDGCLSNPCRNNTCIDRISECYCQSTESFTGLNCEKQVILRMKDFQSTKENWEDSYDMIPILESKN